MKKMLAGFVVCALIAVGAWALLSIPQSTKTTDQNTLASGDTAANEPELLPEQNQSQETNTTAPKAPTTQSIPGPEGMETNPAATGRYLAGTSDELSGILKTYPRVVLFFHAPWCPYCKTANEAFSNRTQEIPAGVAVVRIDYDNEQELKRKYAVTYQHTFVQIDKDGNMVTKWNGGDIDALKTNIK